MEKQNFETIAQGFNQLIGYINEIKEPFMAAEMIEKLMQTILTKINMPAGVKIAALNNTAFNLKFVESIQLWEKLKDEKRSRLL